MFIINTPNGPVDLDSEIGRQDRYNQMMANVLKEKEEMFQLEVDFIVLDKQFKTLREIKPWMQIILDTGVVVVAILCEGWLIEAKINESL